MPDDLTTRVARMMDDYRVGADGMLKDEAARAVVALVLDEAAQACENMRGMGYADVSLTGPMPVGKVIGRAIRALGVET